MHSLITDRATGDMLVNKTEDFTWFGDWKPAIDGDFDLETLFGSAALPRCPARLSQWSTPWPVFFQSSSMRFDTQGAVTAAARRLLWWPKRV
jgi:hypothetical protein